MITLFSKPWAEVPTVWLDVETTGTRPGVDRVVQLGIARFESSAFVAAFTSRVNPGRPIPEEATAVHGLRDEDVADAPTLDAVFALGTIQQLLEGAQPAAYNAPFDRHFIPPFLRDHTWPWLDALSLVRVVDRYVRGSGRHKLQAACARHGIDMPSAHDAGCDARAAGQLFYKLAPLVLEGQTLGEVLRWQREQEAEQWFDFQSWRSRQPSRAQ